jgi:NADH:ubiquinone oxidoreductase subunit
MSLRHFTLRVSRSREFRQHALVGCLKPPGWWGWMHHHDPLPPTSDGYRPKPWEKPHEPDLTGTPGAYHPTGSILSSVFRVLKGQRTRVG